MSGLDIINEAIAGRIEKDKRITEQTLVNFKAMSTEDKVIKFNSLAPNQQHELMGFLNITQLNSLKAAIESA